MPTSKAASNKAQDTTPTDSTSSEAQPVEDQSNTESPSSDTRSVDDLAAEILGGRFGDYDMARKTLIDQGHDASAVLSIVNQRITGGAPHAYKPTAVGLLKQVEDGEWGNPKGLEQRLSAAGFGKPAVAEVLSRLNKE